MTPSHLTAPGRADLPADAVAELVAAYGRLRLAWALLPHRRPRRVPVPVDPALRADLGLAPLRHPAAVSGAWLLRLL
jgi:hypothetical protein